jgi:molybdopterin synthase catalytic subunit
LNINLLIEKVKQHPDYPKAGMILCHNGVVRNNSRNGKKVSGLSISIDHEKLEKIIAENKKKEGIIEILIHIVQNKKLLVGDDIMYLVVAGDIRENVIDVLTKTLNQIKSSVTKKTEFFLE